MKMCTSFFLFTCILVTLGFTMQANSYTEQEMQIIQEARTIWKEKKRRADERSRNRCCYSCGLRLLLRSQKYAKSALVILDHQTLYEKTKNLRTSKDWAVFRKGQVCRRYYFDFERFCKDLIVDEKTAKALRIILNKQQTDSKDPEVKKRAAVEEFRKNQSTQIHLIKKVLANSKKAHEQAKVSA